MPKSKFLDLLFGKRNENPTMQDAISAFIAGEDLFPLATASGAKVSQTSALQITAVYACIKIIAWTLASLPIGVFKDKSPRGREATKKHPIYHLLQVEPNPVLTPFQYFSITNAHQNLWGAGISEIEFDRGGHPVALWPLPPWCVTPKKTAEKNLYYEVRIGTELRLLNQYEVVVFPALSTSPYAWMSPIQTHRETIGFAQALNEFGAKTFGQGTNPAGMISMEGTLNEKSEKSLKKRMEAYKGLSNSHRLMLLDQGMKFDRIGLPPEDAQYLETKKYTVSDIARIYNVPLHLLQDHEKNTSWGRGIEEMNQGFVTFTLLPYLVSYEQEFNRRLFDAGDEHYVKFNVNGLLRGRIMERYRAYSIGRQWGWLSADDIRETEDQNPLPDGQGEIYLTPSNMTNAKEAQTPDNGGPGKDKK